MSNADFFLNQVDNYKIQNLSLLLDDTLLISSNDRLFNNKIPNKKNEVLCNNTNFNKNKENDKKLINNYNNIDYIAKDTNNIQSSTLTGINLVEKTNKQEKV